MSSWNVSLNLEIKLATFNLAFFSTPRQFAKLNSSPNFSAIRYVFQYSFSGPAVSNVGTHHYTS